MKIRHRVTNFHGRPLAASDGVNNEKGLGPSGHGLGQQRIGRFQRQLLLAGEEANDRPALGSRIVRSIGYWRFECVENRPLGNGAGHAYRTT